MSFAAPLWLLLLPLALVAAAVVARARRRGRAALRPFHSTAAGGPVRPAREPAESSLTLLGCAVLTIALAQPRFSASDDERREPPACIFVLDGSRSMLAEDVAPNRFGAAREQLLARARAEPGRRFGLVLFAGGAREVAPPTSDGDALAALLAEVDPRRSADPGSAAGRGLALAVGRLADEARGEIVLLSDGEWDDGNEPDAPAPADQVARARELGLRVTAASFGAPTPTPIVVRDDEGSIVESGPPAYTTASPARVAELAAQPGANGERSAADADASGAAGGSRAAHRFRAWALAGLALLAAAHWLAGRDE